MALIASSSRLGELLVKRGVISSTQLQTALERQTEEGGALSHVLVRLGYVSEDTLVRLLQKEYRLPLVDPSSMDLPAEVLRLVPATLVHRHQLVPIGLSGSTLTVAMCDPANFVALNEVKFLTGYDVKVAVASVSSIAKAIEAHYDEPSGYDDVLSELESDDFEVVKEEEEVDLKELEKAT